ncbi:GLOD4 [Cordylochernes scorpioides]|uniref:GLOD4 n=1 Tax=Cordylochernes scorpioides TaxID=51811 RepID=A0ABY6LB56_9ARAC|nr:GLOD4 [Cordylochernes scorpioides]
MSSIRPLHYVFKVGDRNRTIKFFKNILGMKILRHEEFEEGCKATCNGPYDGKWSKTMVGYGPEDSHFVMELTYNYGVGGYTLGNDLLGITIQNGEAIARAQKEGWEISDKNVALAPGGYKFPLLEGTSPTPDPVQKVTLGCSDLSATRKYWVQLLGLKELAVTENQLELGIPGAQWMLEFKKVGPIDHATAFGRIAFSCPASKLPQIEAKVKEAEGKILTPLVSLDTPGKATVQVVILSDPDGHEICFVGDEAFRELSQVDPKADDLLAKAIEADKSSEWFTKKGLTKSEL